MHSVNWRIMSIHLNNISAAANFKSMSIRSPHGIAARTARTATKVMVAVLAGPDAPLVATPAELPRWRRLTPLALWSTVSVRDSSPDEILRCVAAEVARQDVEAPQVILLGEGKAARTALELVLRGTLDCAGLLAIAVHCAPLPFRIVPTAAAVRLVVRRENCADAPEFLITTLQATDIDARIVRLDPPAAKVARAAASAAETFVLELVANAGRQSRHHGV
ncbi:hypothetical protein [Bradyrhizobium australafricanum]|uniref:hypothetical protein n=1 Tax=Bradyrhizobium australafricanum TaxID=2821406 RepID=UPI001CE2B7C2|nr:hypothetical protein [Bradyrhizobium australafricanum]